MPRYQSVPVWQKRIAVISSDRGRFYYSDSYHPETLYPENGCGTRSEAMREAHRNGFTHAAGLTTWAGNACKRIPAYLRD